MQQHYSKTKLAAAQEDLWLAEVEREDQDTLVITLAGPGGIILLECSGLSAFALAQESLDPDVLPKDLVLEDEFQLSAVTEFNPDDEIAAKITEVSPEYADDVLCASKATFLDGDLDTLKKAALLLDLRVESWRLSPQPLDLHLLIGCTRLMIANEAGEVDITHVAGEVEDHHESSGPAAPYTAPSEPPFELDQQDLPQGILEVLRRFFEAGLNDDFNQLADLVPSFDLSHAEQAAHFAEHFHSLYDWGYARALDGWGQDGPLATVRIRGVIHSRAEDGITAINEECVWSFSLRKTKESWVIRNWATSWPSVGSAPHLPEEKKPWLKTWNSGPIV